MRPVKGALLALAAPTAAALIAVAGVGGAAGAAKQNCAQPVYQNGLELVFGRAKTQAATDKITAYALRTGFKGTQTVRDTCTLWKSVLRGIDSYDAAVGVQAEARRVKLYPTIECLTAQEIGQFQAIFGTRANLAELSEVIQRANSFGYRGLKTKTAPCGGYQAYIAGFSDMGQAVEFAHEASDRTGLKVVAIKA